MELGVIVPDFIYDKTEFHKMPFFTQLNVQLASAVIETIIEYIENNENILNKLDTQETRKFIMNTISKTLMNPEAKFILLTTLYRDISDINKEWLKLILQIKNRITWYDYYMSFLNAGEEAVNRLLVDCVIDMIKTEYGVEDKIKNEGACMEINDTDTTNDENKDQIQKNLTLASEHENSNPENDYAKVLAEAIMLTTVYLGKHTDKIKETVKKGITPTEDEQKQFLIGLYNFVIENSTYSKDKIINAIHQIADIRKGLSGDDLKAVYAMILFEATLDMFK